MGHVASSGNVGVAYYTKQDKEKLPERMLCALTTRLIVAHRRHLGRIIWEFGGLKLETPDALERCRDRAEWLWISESR